MPLVDQYDFHGLTIEVHRQSTGMMAHPHLAMSIGGVGRILGGGAEVDQAGGAGNLLTAAYPVSAQEWECSAKDHELPSPAIMNVFCLVADIPQNDYTIVQNTSPTPAPHPQATATLPADFILVGGGAKANAQPGAPGSLLYASRPGPGESWFAAAKDHKEPSPATVTAYAIGIHRRVLTAHGMTVVRFQTLSAEPVPHPSVSCGIDQPSMTLIAAGAETRWSTAGSLLTAVFPSPHGAPSTPQTYHWTARGKDHIDPDPSLIVLWGIALLKL